MSKPYIYESKYWAAKCSVCGRTADATGITRADLIDSMLGEGWMVPSMCDYPLPMCPDCAKASPHGISMHITIKDSTKGKCKMKIEWNKDAPSRVRRMCICENQVFAHETGGAIYLALPRKWHKHMACPTINLNTGEVFDCNCNAEVLLLDVTVKVDIDVC